MNIIGLGKAGCTIADQFAEYPQYDVFKIDVDVEGTNCLKIPHQPGPEEYERDTPSFKQFFSNIEGETFLVMGGSGDITALSLRVMQQIENSCETTVLYVRPDIDLLSETKKMHERVTYNVLQEYARSGKLKGICLINNSEIENILDNVPIMGYYKKLNDLIISTLHMINVYKNTEPIMGSLSEAGEAKRIYTVGLFDIENNKEKLFFPLDNVKERCYIYSISKERLQTESGLHKLITNQMKEKLSEENTSVSFGVFPTDYNNDYGYVIYHSSKIQS